MKLDVGQVFTSKESRDWKDEAGRAHTHSYTVRGMVTRISNRGFSWETLAIEDEKERPSESFAFTPDRGETAWFAADLYLKSGRMTLV